MNVQRMDGRGRALWLSGAIVLLLVALAVAPSLTRRASAAGNVNVNTTSLANDPLDGKCDLHEALQVIAQANSNDAPSTYHECSANPGPNVVTFSGPAAGGTLTFGPTTDDLPFVWGDTTIMGPVTIAGSSGIDTHFFRLAGDAILTLNGVTLQNGYTSGGGAAILDTNQATVNIILSSLIGNTARNDGGAINSNGTLSIVNSNFSGNQALGLATGSGFGGAINMSGSGALKVSQSNFAGNSAGRGGAIWVSSQVATISDAVFNGNISNPITPTILSGGGGAVWVDADTAIAIVRTAFNGNLSPGASGGALFNDVSTSTFITDTSFNANIAGTLSSAQMAGALYNQGTLHIDRSAFINNIAAGGDGGGLVVDHAGTAVVANTTFAANGAPQSNGGGIVVTQTQSGGPASSLVGRNLTLWTNAAKPPSGHGGNLFVAAGQAASLGNTILDGGVSDNCTGAVTSVGHNIDSGTSCAFGGAGDLSSTDPKLDTPSHNGGPIASLLSQKLKFGSPAIDTGDNAICAAAPVNNEDQNGDARPSDGNNNGISQCDIGAVENGHPLPGYGSTPVQPGPIDLGNTQVATTITGSLSAENTGDFPLTLLNPSMGGANAGEFAVLTAFPIVIIPGDSPVTISVRCTPLLAVIRSATLTFNTDDPKHLSVSYNLTCHGTASPAAGFGSTPAAPGPISFPPTAVGDAYTATISIMETGDAPLNVSSGSISGANAGDFRFGTTLPLSIAEGGAPKAFKVACAPSDVGLRTATLTLSTNDPNHGTVVFNLLCPASLPPSPFLVPGTSLTNIPAKGLNNAYGVAGSPDGKNVYVSSYLSGTISTFKRNVTTGALSFVAQDSVFLNRMDGARLLAASPDGKSVYGAGSVNGTLIQFMRDQTNGDLSAIHGYTPANMAGAYGVAISSDGRFVYVSASTDNSVVVFSRNLTTGDLNNTPVQTVQSAANLGGAHGLALSPDGANAYVTGFISTTEGTLAVYKRDANSGKLTFVEKHQDYSFICIFPPCTFGLNGAFQVAVSPDGANVYVVGEYDHALAAFKRNPVNGKLSFLDSYVDDTNGVYGLNLASGVDVSPDGLHVITSGYGDRAATVFDRDPATGLLTFNQEIKRSPFSGAGGDPPLAGVRDVRFSPDGHNAYAAGSVDDAVAVLTAANPVPQINALNPASSQPTSAGITLTVSGANFIPGSTFRWNGSNRPTTYNNAFQLTVSLLPGDLLLQVPTPVTVRNPSPGGGTSNVLTFTVTAPNANPLPAIDHLNPQGALAGSGAFSLQVVGSNFIASSVVRWNGQNRTTHFVNASTLMADITAADIGQPGLAAVSVFTGGPGGGPSNVVSFSAAAPGQNPVPSITQLNPASVYSHGAASQEFTLVVTGMNFVDGASVQWNGQPRPTHFVNSTMLRATITPADSAVPGSDGVSVLNPAPGGGLSNALTFIVRKWFPIFLPLLRR